MVLFQLRRLTALAAEGEIDIIENVHSSRSNQVAWHTSPGLCFSSSGYISLMHVIGCNLVTPGNFSGTAGSTTCDATINYNTGCGIVDASVASFGPTFNELGGGVYAMKWDELSIDVCKPTNNIHSSLDH